MKFVAGNAQHIGARPQQQDAFGFSDPSDPEFVAHAGFLGVVADGMGGLTHGTEVSRSAVLAFLNAYERKSATEPIPKALTRCLNEANMAVLRVAEHVLAGEEVGTTLVAAILHGHTLHWVSVGDSRIYLLRGSNLTQLTVDHVYARELNRQAAEGRISLRDAQSHPERAALTSYLGQRELAHVDRNAHPVKVQSDDCVMLCSDGFYRALTEQEIVAGFRTGPQKACETLLRQALAKHRKQQDNLTVIALRRPTRSPIHRSHKVVLAATAMLLAVLFGYLGYLAGQHFALPDVPPLTISPPRPPTSALGEHTLTTDESHPTKGGTAVPKPANPEKAQAQTSTPSPTKPRNGKTSPFKPKAETNGTAAGKAATPTSKGPKTAAGTSPTGQGKAAQEQSGAQEKGNIQEKSGSSQTSPQEQQNKTKPTPTPGVAPTTPTVPATPSSPPKEDQPKTPNAPQKMIKKILRIRHWTTASKMPARKFKDESGYAIRD